MGAASTETGEEDHGTPMGVAIGLNTLINAVINAGFGYLIAWLHWQDYTLSWYVHELHGLFELGFVVEDLVVQGVSVGLIVTLIVAAILHRQWDADHLRPGRIERFELHEERTRGRHLLAWAGGMSLMGFAISVGVGALLAAGFTEIPGGTFALARTVNGFLVGAIAGGFVTASWVTNLSAGKLVEGEGQDAAVARLMTSASGRPWIVLGVVALLTAGLGAGVTDLGANVNESDALARGTGDHQAALAVEDGFNASHQLGIEWHFSTDPDACRSDAEANLPARAAEPGDCGNITDEVYVRAMEEAFGFVSGHSYEPEDELLAEDTDRVFSPVEAQHGLPAFVKLANWTMAGGQGQAGEDAYELPRVEDRARWNGATQLGWDRLGSAMSATIGVDGEQAVVTYQVDPETELTSRQIGAFATDARQAYVDWAETEGDWSVFTGDNQPKVTVDRPEANAHQATQLDEDFSDVLAVLGLGLFLGSAIVFRDPLAAGLATLTVAIAGLWTFGLMGHADVALSELDLVHVPVLLAAGVVFTVPTIETFLREAEETDAEQAIEATSEALGLPLSLGGYVAAAGLVALGLSPTVLAADAAWVSLFGLASAFGLTVTFVPAGLAAIGTTGRLVSFEEEASLGSGDSWASRGLAAAVVLALTLASLAALGGLQAQGWGQAVETWPAEDERRSEHEQAVFGFHDLDEGEDGYANNLVVLEGEVTHPQALSYQQRLAEELASVAEESQALSVDRTRSLPAEIDDWLDVCCGAESLAGPGLEPIADEQEQADRSPSTQGEVEATLVDMFASPYAPHARQVIAEPTGDVAVIPVDVRQGHAQQGWERTQAAIEAAEGDRPNDVQTSLVGPTAASQLAGEEQVPWLFYLLAAGTGLAALLGLGYTRELAGTLVPALAVGLGGLWALGLVAATDVAFSPAAGAGLAVGLLVAGTFAARRVLGTASGASARVGLFSVVLLVGLLAGVFALLDASAGFPSPIAEEGIQVAVAAIVSGFAAQALVGRALAPKALEAEERTVVVEADEAGSA